MSQQIHSTHNHKHFFNIFLDLYHIWISFIDFFSFTAYCEIIGKWKCPINSNVSLLRAKISWWTIWPLYLEKNVGKSVLVTLWTNMMTAGCWLVTTWSTIWTVLTWTLVGSCQNRTSEQNTKWRRCWRQYFDIDLSGIQ